MDKFGKKYLASVAGLEPATFAFVAQHSYFQLSYTEKNRNDECRTMNDELNFIQRSSLRLHLSLLVESVGLEPTMTGVQNQRLANLATTPTKNQTITFLSACHHLRKLCAVNLVEAVRLELTTRCL